MEKLEKLPPKSEELWVMFILEISYFYLKYFIAKLLFLMIFSIFNYAGI